MGSKQVCDRIGAMHWQQNTVVTRQLYIWLAILCCTIIPTTTTTAQETTPAIALAGMLNLADIHGNTSTLVYDADTRTGAILHDTFFTINDTEYEIKRIEVTQNTFSLQITEEGEETNEAEVLANYYLVFKKEFSSIGYIEAKTLTTHQTTATAALSDAHGLQKNDFLEFITFEITKVKPIVNRYPEKIQPLPTIVQKITDRPINIQLTDYFKDPEGTPIQFNTSLDGTCCVVHHHTQGNTLTLTPIGIGTTAIEIEAYDAQGYLTTESMEIEILKSEAEPKDTDPPTIITENLIEVPSHTTPSILITVDHQNHAGENLQVMFDGSDTCKQLSSDTIQGTSTNTKQTTAIYSGILTGDNTNTAYGYQEKGQIGNLTPSTVEIDGIVYRIRELLYTDNKNVTLHITQDSPTETENTPTAPDLSDYYLVIQNKNRAILGYTSITQTEKETHTIPLTTGSAAWFDGTMNTTIELTKAKPGEIPAIPPQQYTVTIKGTPGIYTNCTLTIKDGNGNRAKKSIPLSMFTILRNEKQLGAELRKRYPKIYAPYIPKQQTPKKPWSLLIEQKEKEAIEKLLYIGELTLQLASPDISTSSVQIVDLGRRSYIPEVKNLQIFLNLIGYTVAQTGWGSRGMETEYFGPATEKAIKELQKENNIPVTGELDEETKAMMLTLALTKAEELIQNQ